MAFTNEQVERLEEVIATGAKEVRTEDRHVVQYDVDDLLKLRQTMKDEAAVVNGRVRRRRMILLAGGTGL